MTQQQVLLKYLQHLLPEVQRSLGVLAQVEELIELAEALETVVPLDSLLSEEYQAVTDQTKKAEWVAERIARLAQELG
jgi:hypothetical protein